MFAFSSYDVVVINQLIKFNQVMIFLESSKDYQKKKEPHVVLDSDFDET